MTDETKPKNEGRAKGGVARAAALDPSRRSEIAQRAAIARWGSERAVEKKEKGMLARQKSTEGTVFDPEAVTITKREYERLQALAAKKIPDAAFRSGRVGLYVCNPQPLDNAMVEVISAMVRDCDTVIVGVGSSQEGGTYANPFSFDQRVAMLRAVFGDLVKPIQLQDIGSAPSTTRWVEYVLDRVRKMNLPAPTDCYAASRSGAGWYAPRFAPLTGAPAVMGAFSIFESEDGKRLHVLDRTRTAFPIGNEEIRTLIAQRNPEWHDCVPAKIVRWVDDNYPADHRVEVEALLPKDADA